MQSDFDLSSVTAEKLEVRWKFGQYIKGKEEGGGRFCVVLDDVLSEAECNYLQQLAEAKGYEQALVNIGGGRQELILDSRKSERCIIDDAEIVAEIFRRIKSHLPDTMELKSDRTPKQLLGLNERLRFLRYTSGDYFRPHYDGTYEREDQTARSLLTVMVYLNDSSDMEGGDTIIFDDFSHAFDTPILHRIKPKKGRVLVFQHDCYHSGEEVTSGTKLCIRTDVMYAWRDQPVPPRPKKQKVRYDMDAYQKAIDDSALSSGDSMQQG
jgi:predicted 2-oxoglutarate/Fe(II)-dependent dioxygenase YbiX